MDMAENSITAEIFSFGNKIFANGLILSVLYILFAYIAARILIRIINNMLDTMAIRTSRDNDMLFILIKKIIKMALLAVVAIIALYEILPFRSLGTAAIGATGVITVAITLGAQEVASNFVSGFILSLYQPFKKGDLIYIKEKDISGVIEDMNFRHSTIRTYDNTLIIIPNNILSSAIVENRGSADSEPYNNLFYIDIDYTSNYHKAIEMLENFLKKESLVVRKDKIFVSVGELKDSSISLKIRVYTRSLDDGYVLKGRLNEFVLDELRKADIEIPYPHITVTEKK